MWLVIKSIPSKWICVVIFFFKKKTAYELRISDWSSDVCSSDLIEAPPAQAEPALTGPQSAVPPSSQSPSAADASLAAMTGGARSEERRVGKESVSTCRSRCTP